MRNKGRKLPLFLRLKPQMKQQARVSRKAANLMCQTKLKQVRSTGKLIGAEKARLRISRSLKKDQKATRRRRW